MDLLLHCLNAICSLICCVVRLSFLVADSNICNMVLVTWTIYTSQELFSILLSFILFNYLQLYSQQTSSQRALRLQSERLCHLHERAVWICSRASCGHVFHHQCIANWMSSIRRSAEQSLTAAPSTAGSSPSVLRSNFTVQEVIELTFEERKIVLALWSVPSVNA